MIRETALNIFKWSFTRQTCYKQQVNSAPLYPLADLFIPLPTRFSVKHSSHAAILCEEYSLAFPPLYSQVHVYRLVNWGEVERTKMPNLRNGSKGSIQTWALDCESGILPLRYCAPQNVVTFVQKRLLQNGKICSRI